MCWWIWHKWGKWETVMLRWVTGYTIRTLVTDDMTSEEDVVGQQRTCNRCGKTAIRQVVA